MSGHIETPADGEAVIAASIDGAGLIDEDEFVRANAELAVTFGYEDSDDLVGTSWTELYPETEQERIEGEILPRVREERRWRGEVVGMRVDGSTFPQVLSVCQSGNGRLVWIVREGSPEGDPVPGPMAVEPPGAEDGRDLARRELLDALAGENRAGARERDEPPGVVDAALDVVDELETRYRIHELLLETIQELIQASGREAIERTVCERLTASDLYEFAWIGKRELGGDRIVPQTRAGEDSGYVDAVANTGDESDAGGGLADRAMRTGNVQVVDVGDSSLERRRETAEGRGFESAVVVPLRHGEAAYGVLVVHATRENAFDERERAGFEVLGRTAGFVMHATRSRELLFADTVVELELDLGGTAWFARVAADFDCDLSLDGYVASTSGNRWILYFTVTGASPGTIVESMADQTRVEGARVVNERSGGGRIELVVSESSLLRTAVSAGSTVRTVEADADGARTVIEAPVSADSRHIIDLVRDEYPGARLVAHRERDHETSGIGRPGGLLDELTDRQRESLEAAFRAGYFTWPRESTGEEVADSLDLSSATLHGHLRKAEQVILSTLFDEY